MSGGPLRTRLCDVLGIDVPIIQAPITDDAALPLAVAGAGALGLISATWVDDVAAAVRSVRGAKVGVNFVLEWPMERRLDDALAAGARTVSLAWGDAGALTQRAKQDGATVLVSVASAEEAKRAEQAGADVVVAQGWEAGGHVSGEVTTLVLVPAVVDAVSVPVVAAGGIGDGRGLAAVLSLGAAGAWIGTRFLASTESTSVYKERIVAARETDAVYTHVFSIGWPAPHRVLPNSALEAGDPRPLNSPRHPGEVETAALYAGQSAALVRDVKPAAEIVRDLVAEAESALREARRAVDVPLEPSAE